MIYYAPPEGSYEDSHAYTLMSGVLNLVFAAVLRDEHAVHPPASVARPADHSQSITDHSDLRCAAYLSFGDSFGNRETGAASSVRVSLHDNAGEASGERHSSSRRV